MAKNYKPRFDESSTKLHSLLHDAKEYCVNKWHIFKIHLPHDLNKKVALSFLSLLVIIVILDKSVNRDDEEFLKEMIPEQVTNLVITSELVPMPEQVTNLVITSELAPTPSPRFRLFKKLRRKQ